MSSTKTFTEEEKRQSSIWLEVTNVRLEDKRVELQLKGDRADREPVWWEVDLVTAGFGEAGKEVTKAKPDPNAAYKAIADGLDKKKLVLAKLAIDAPTATLKCTSIRVQYAESTSR